MQDALRSDRNNVMNEAEIKKAVEPHENDVIIIAGGDSEQFAEEGAMAAAWVLIE
jgi:hypothetical protein